MGFWKDAVFGKDNRQRFTVTVEHEIRVKQNEAVVQAKPKPESKPEPEKFVHPKPDPEPPYPGDEVTPHKTRTIRVRTRGKKAEDFEASSHHVENGMLELARKEARAPVSWVDVNDWKRSKPRFGNPDWDGEMRRQYEKHPPKWGWSSCCGWDLPPDVLIWSRTFAPGEWSSFEVLEREDEEEGAG